MILRTGNNFNDIKYLGIYHPWHGGSNPNFNTFSGEILDVKNQRSQGQIYFRRELLNLLSFDAFIITSAPSSEAHTRNNNGIAVLARQVASSRRNITDGTNCLIRHRSIPSSHTSGNRTIEKHLESIRVENTILIENKNILLLDDVTSSGSTIRACKQLLIQVGAQNVQCLALGHTSGYNLEGFSLAILGQN